VSSYIDVTMRRITLPAVVGGPTVCAGRGPPLSICMFPPPRARGRADYGYDMYIYTYCTTNCAYRHELGAVISWDYLLPKVYTYKHTSIHPYTHTPIHPYTHTPIHPYTHTYILVHTCTYHRRSIHAHSLFENPLPVCLDSNQPWSAGRPGQQ